MTGLLRWGRGAVLSLSAGALLLLALTSAPAAQAGPATCTGNLQVVNVSNNAVLGFVRKTWNSFGEFVVTNTASD